MIFIVCAVRDRAVDAFGRPIFVATNGAAIRSFSDEVNRSGADSPMHQHPEDYDLYQLGTFDDGSGKFECLEQPRMLAVGKDCFTGDR